MLVKKGIILKVVVFDEIDTNTYNLGFGDYNFENEIIDDKVNSKNGDMEKIMATLVAIINDFSVKNKNCQIFLSGSDSIRTRFYQMAILKFYDEFSAAYEIKGTIDGFSESFQKNKKYESFLIRKMFIKNVKEMKTQTQKLEMPKINIIPDDGTYDFLKGKNFFAEKTARAKEAFKKIKMNSL